MNTLKLGRWNIEYDPDATTECFLQLPLGSDCTCNECQNFMAVLDIAFPSEFRSIASTLGIDIQKPAELTHFARMKSGLHLTGGWFHFVGKILNGPDGFKQAAENAWQTDFDSLVAGFDFGLTNRLALVPESFNNYGLIQLEFHTHVPWVIAAPECD